MGFQIMLRVLMLDDLKRSNSRSQTLFYNSENIHFRCTVCIRHRQEIINGLSNGDMIFHVRWPWKVKLKVTDFHRFITLKPFTLDMLFVLDTDGKSLWYQAYCPSCIYYYIEGVWQYIYDMNTFKYMQVSLVIKSRYTM